MIHHFSNHIHRNGKADADIASTRPNDGGVDSNEFAAKGHQRTAGVSRIYGGIGLDEILLTLDAEPSAAKCAYDTLRDSLPNSEWIADGNDVISNFKLIGISECYRRRAFGENLNDGYILHVWPEDAGRR